MDQETKLNVTDEGIVYGHVYPLEKFEDYYVKFDTVRDITQDPEWDRCYKEFYQFNEYELDIPVGELPYDQTLFDGETILEELKKCTLSFEYFCHRYVKILHPMHGTIPFILYKYQRTVVDNYESNRFNIMRKFRQGGLTTVAVLWGLWKCLFQTDQQVYVLSKTDREAVSAGEIAKRALDHIPAWMYDIDTAELTKHEKVFYDTDSRLCFYTPKAARGKSATLIIIDEAAFIPDMYEEWKGMYPVIATGGSVEVVSTVNGLGNWYEQIYHEAQANKNYFNVIDLDYWEHPEYANPEWAKQMYANLGEKAWRQEVLGSFLGSGETYIAMNIIGQLDHYTVNHMPIRTAFNKWQNRSGEGDAHPDWAEGALWVWKEPADGHDYMIGVDCAEGVGEGGDNSCFQVIDVATLEQVAEFYSNTVPPHVFAQILNQVGLFYNMATIVVENMSVGGAVLSSLQHDLAYEAVYHENKKGRMGQAGIKMGMANRPVFLETLQHRLINHTLRINSPRFVHELKTFLFNAQKKKAEAIRGRHDDAIIAMCLALHTREDQMRGVPVGAEVPAELTQIFKTDVYEEIKREIIEGSPINMLSDENAVDPLLFPDNTPTVQFKIKRKHDKLLKEFGWTIIPLIIGFEEIYGFLTNLVGNVLF